MDGVSLDAFIQEPNSYIHWYNHKRIKLSLGGMSPLEYRHNWAFTKSVQLFVRIPGNFKFFVNLLYGVE